MKHFLWRMEEGVCAGGDMGACALLPRLIGQGRASELLYTGRSMSADEGAAWGFFNRVVEPVLEWNVTVDQAIDMEAVAQAELMQTKDFQRAYEAFAAKKKPVFQGD